MAPPILWQPSEQFKLNSNLARYMQWVHGNLHLEFKTYSALWEWSVQHPADFWKSISDYFKVIHHSSYSSVMSNDPMPYTKWFQGSTLNYAEHIFRNATNKHPAILFQSEHQPLISISWDALKQKVAALQSFFFTAGHTAGRQDRGLFAQHP